MENNIKSDNNNEKILEYEFLYNNYFPDYEEVNTNIDNCLIEYQSELKKITPPEDSSTRIKDIHNYLLNFNENELNISNENLKKIGKSKLMDIMETSELLNLKLIMEHKEEISNMKNYNLNIN